MYPQLLQAHPHPRQRLTRAGTLFQIVNVKAVALVLRDGLNVLQVVFALLRAALQDGLEDDDVFRRADRDIDAQDGLARDALAHRLIEWDGIEALAASEKEGAPPDFNRAEVQSVLARMLCRLGPALREEREDTRSLLAVQGNINIGDGPLHAIAGGGSPGKDALGDTTGVQPLGGLL